MAQASAAAAVANIWKTTELKDKILFTLLCLVIYRVGSHVTVPGVDVIALTDFFANQGKGGLLGLYDLFVGGGLSRATVFALGIMPYISASIFMQIAGAVVPQIDKMQKEEEGRKAHQPVDPLPHRGACGRAGVGLRPVHRVAAGCSRQPRTRVQGRDGAVPHDRRDFRHVAR